MKAIQTVSFILLFVASSLISFSSAQLAQFAGTWKNTKFQKDGIKRLKIKTDGSSQVKLSVSSKFRRGRSAKIEGQAFTMNPLIPIEQSASSITATLEEQGTIQLLLIEPQSPGLLKVDIFTQCLTPTGPSNTRSTEFFKRIRLPKPKPMLKSDLEIIEIFEPQFRAFQKFTKVQFTIQNKGQGSTQCATDGTFEVKLIDPSTRLSDGKPFVAITRVSKMAPGATQQLMFQLPYNAFNPIATLKLIVDSKNEIQESDEFNNKKYIKSVLKADLKVLQIIKSKGKGFGGRHFRRSHRYGGSLEIQVLVQNIGKGSTKCATDGSFEVKLASSDSLACGTQVFSGETKRIGEIKSGEVKLITFKIPYRVFKQCSDLKIILDPQNEIKESNELNNIKQIQKF